MYEAHFGLSAPPFQLSPDPSFYFDSKGHSNALAYLRFGAYQGEGFIVVTGEIGAGKTTLVRALLAELNTEKVVAAQIVSTQLEAGDLLRSILAAFGLSSTGLTKAQLIASLEAFLTLLTTRGQRALLIVDEAQNLNQEAVEEMRMLSNFQFDQHALLQSFLVGQPELRKLLQTKSMEQFRQRVIASCHLGPLDAAETRAYVEHRLRRVGWQEYPHFEPEAFDAIHALSGGIPRRINVLCNRLLLGAYLKDAKAIDLPAVTEVAEELRAEVGDHSKVESLPRVAPASQTPAAVKSLPSAGDVLRLQRTPGIKPDRPILLVADEAASYLKVRALAASLEAVGGLDAVVVTVRSGRDLRADDALLDPIPAPSLQVGLNVAAVNGAELISQTLLRFDAELAGLDPAAVAIIGESAGVLACALASAERGVPLLRLDGGVREGARSETAALLDRLAAKVMTRSVNFHHVLARDGVPADRVECVGSLWNTLISQLPSEESGPSDVLRRFGVSETTLSVTRPFGLLTISGSQGRTLARQVDALTTQLKGALPLLWLVDGVTGDAVRAAALDTRLERQRILLLPATTSADRMALLRTAALLVTDSSACAAEEAGVFQVPVLELAADGGNADDLVQAIHDLLATPRTASPIAPVQRATASVIRWLADITASTSFGSRASNGPDPRR